ncbi:unnamed protein product [Diamesa serratosioi]
MGEHISHNLTQHHTRNYYDDKLSDLDNHLVHYQIDMLNKTMHLEMEPSTQFIAPLMLVERHKRDINVRHKRPLKHTQCHYQGHIRGHENSRVALSACNGLSGYFKTKNNEYWIEPSKNHKLTNDGHRHIVFQRSSVKNINKNKQKKKSHSCGTREPKRVTEKRIEYQRQGKVIVQGGRKVRNQVHHNQSKGQPNRKMNKNKHGIAKKRFIRSVITARHVEALVVADPSMMQFHDSGGVENYLLTIMNMVSSLYKDPSIGNSVQVVVVKIIILEEDHSYLDLNVTNVAATTLERFCRWQRTLNPKTDEDPHHHDVAILVTRKDICSNSGCSTLGIANVGGMCRPDKSCSVNEDNGITLAHTITHELGHNFGMYHDTAKTGCDHRSGPILHIMTPSFEADIIHVSWSNCSRTDITHFLDQGLGKCLEDAPGEEEYPYPDLPVGAMYNADLQCRMQFNSTDEDIKVCSQLNELCSQLWCSLNNTCTSLLKPAAPGTHCARHKWCQNQKCVMIEELPTPVDGGWGNWSGWSQCSQSCGAGVAKQTRECNHPAPVHGGTFCIGERGRYKICNIEACPLGDPSFRAQQCSKQNGLLVHQHNYTWLPYFDPEDPCKLYCTNVEDTIIQAFGDSAGDGTPCNIGTNDMCIGGVCRTVGCDWIVDSNVTEDHCGVCGGNGSLCTTVKGTFMNNVNVSDGYYEITIIPSGSRYIFVEEIVSSKNYIGVGKTNSKFFYLNGNRTISMSGEYVIAGSLALYNRAEDKEELRIPGPIKDEISLYIVLKGKNKNLGIKYEYTLPSKFNDEQLFYWKLSDFTTCTKTCGGGIQQRFPVCYKRLVGIVEHEQCTSAKNKRPEMIQQSCNPDKCPAYWWIGPWQPCPVTCRKNEDIIEPMKRRTIMCVDHHEFALPSKQCLGQERPIDIEICSSVMPSCNIEYNTYYGDNLIDNEISNSSFYYSS